MRDVREINRACFDTAMGRTGTMVLVETLEPGYHDRTRIIRARSVKGQLQGKVLSSRPGARGAMTMHWWVRLTAPWPRRRMSLRHRIRRWQEWRVLSDLLRYR